MYFGSKRKSAARRLKLRDRIISMLLAVSLLCGNPIVLPTGAAELVAYCEIEEHSHSEECYTTDSVLTCGVTQENHVHSEACKQTEKTLTCTIVEQVHEHTDACYTTTTNLTCTEHVHTADCAQLTCTDTTEGHTHTDACYAYTCDSPNSTHQHTDSCYTTESVLNCDYHQHTDECYTTTEVNTCGVTQENHKHSEACYGEQKTLFCTQEEHTHTLAYYSNPEADLQTADDWKDTLPKEDDFTGTWAKDLLAVAESQLGYKESDKNYQVAEDGETLMGYNRYGAWYSSYTPDENQPYLDWNVTFLFFSIYYSGISDFPLEETCADWVESLNSYDLYREVGKTYPVSEEDTEGEAYTPTPGDMVFVDTDGDGEADRVGVFSESKENLLTGKQLIVIEGDVDGAVAEVAYAEDTDAAAASEDTDSEPRIVGYADMTQAQADAQPENGDVSMLLTWDTTSYLYLDISTYGWATDGAHIVLAYYDGDNDWSFSEMTHYLGTLYQIELPDNMVLDNGGMFEFVRMNSTGTFSWNNKWNRTGSEGVYHTLQSGTNVFKLNGWHSGVWESYVQQPTNSGSSGGGTGGETDTLPELADGCRRVFYDATLSKLSYTGDSGAKSTGIPATDGGTIYYYDYTNRQAGVMTKLKSYSIDGTQHTWTDVYFVDVPVNCQSIAFAAYVLDGSNLAWSGNSTGQLTIPNDNACFYADSSDPSIYGNEAGNVRGGYWGEAFMVRNPGTVVVDIPQETRENAADTLYLNTTFYDYYTDFELNGNNRNDYSTSASKTTHRIYQPFRQFNQALSSYYSGISASNPLYWGNFQNYSGDHFDEIAGTLNLYGYSADNKAKFFAENNSMWGYDGKELTNNDKDGAQATMGLVSNELTNGNLMIKTSGGSAIAPFFSKSFLEGGNSKNTVLGKVYENVSFPFTKEALGSSSDPDATGTVDYWVFDSRVTTLRLKEDSTAGYWLDSTDDPVYGSTATQASTSDKNFFPFNSGSQSATSQRLNYGFATKLELKFRLTEDGTVKTTNTADDEEVPIEFNFSGDDDVWVFIDGKLALDVGGGHGRVAGYLNFRDKTYHVDRVKGSNGGVVYGKNDTFTMNGANTDEHTLTMFYMERGLWESNMKVTFNFPDENQLEVEKQVDTTEVNSLFTSVFSDQKLFTFNIKNLATHFPDVDAKGASYDPIELNVAGSGVTSYSGNTFNRGTYQNKNNALHWWAALDDTSSAYRHKRYGVLTLPETVDITNMTKLSFYMYYDDSTGFSLSNLYLQLLDADTASGDLVGSALTAGDNNALGCIGTSLAGKTYGSTSTAGKTWVKITLDLSLLDKGTGFDKTRVQYLRFGCNLTRNIYLWGFTFEPAAKTTNPTGFITQQYDVPSYGSAKTGELENASGAVYTSSLGNSTRASYVVDQNGHFALQNGEIVNFHDQFRRGSYIYLEEILSAKEQELYNTTWTMYENDKAVTSFGTGTTTTNPTPIPDMTDVASMTVTDSRVEYYQTTDSSGKDPKNKYEDPENPGAFLFRSYANPDSTATTTKLKAVFTNKVNVGSLTISKMDADKDNAISSDETFTFAVEFYNVGGLGLENGTITTTFTLKVGDTKTIFGIPINTEYAVYEIKSDNANITLDHITDDVYTDKYPYEVTTYKVDGTDKGAYMASGVIDGETNNVTYYNIQKEVVSLKLTKLWDGLAENEEPPMSIKVQLQCSTDGDEWVSYNDYYAAKDIGPGYESWTGYTFEFTNLDKYFVAENGTKTPYQYRVVELDSEGNVITSTNNVKGVLDVNGTKYEVTYGEVVNAKDGEGNEIDNQFTQTITNKLKPNLSINVEKKWVGITTGITQPASVQVQLQQKASETDWTAVSTKTLNAENSWKYTFENLTEKDASGNAYEYRVVELNGDTAMDKDGDTFTVTTVEGENAVTVEYRVTYETTKKTDTAPETWTITNTVVPEVTLQITKLDATDTNKKLDGVEFKLEKDGDSNFVKNVTTDENGIANFAGLKAGTYTLTETKAKSGYSLLKSSIEIVITENTDKDTGAITYTATVGNNEAESFVLSGNTYTLGMTVYNKQGLTMPSTGGTHGFEYWILGGLCITAIPLLLYTLLGFKKGGKYSRK